MTLVAATLTRFLPQQPHDPRAATVNTVRAPGGPSRVHRERARARARGEARASDRSDSRSVSGDEAASPGDRSADLKPRFLRRWILPLWTNLAGLTSPD